MSTFLNGLIDRAKQDKKTIILPESEDERTLAAAEKILAEGIANLILIGDEDAIAHTSYKLDGAEIVNPLTDSRKESLAQLLYETRKHKGVTLEQAIEKIKDPVWYGIMLMKDNQADGLVSGACHPTIDILSPSLRVLKTAPGSKMVSAFFIMVVPDCEYGDDGLFFFADPALEIQPSADRLAQIAVATGRSYQALLGKEPNIALMSHSTYGSAKNDDSQKVVDAVKMAKELAPDLNIDGEMQADAAIVPSIGASKAPDSPVAGKANVLVFPDLDAGNIGYKLVQRLAKAEAYGPILQGVAAPVNDLSRGCTAEDIVGVVAITCIQAQAKAAAQKAAE
ncbi:MAG: phosphate acetyltransferase [Eggerthellaceae bacterium]|jgi:phosphate acetyltransferase